VQELAREQRLKNALLRVAAPYDYVLIDCPPSLNLLTLNGLVAADSVLIPMVCEYYALEGLSDLVGTLRKVRAAVNPKIEIIGLLRTMFDVRSNLSQQVSAQLAQHFRNKVFETVIPRNIRLAEAPSHGLPALVYDRSARGAQAYLTLAGELLSRLESEPDLTQH
jgi:chromosome partitioning protein